MPKHASFAAAIGVKQQTLQDLFDAFYNGNKIQHTLNINSGGTIVDFFLEPFMLTCSSKSGSRLMIDITARGALTITPSDGNPITRNVLFGVRIFIPLIIELNTGILLISFDGINSSVDSFNIEVISGGPYTPAAQQIIDSQDFKNDIQVVIQSALKNFKQIPSLDISALGEIFSISGNSVKYIISDGTMILGIDVNNANGLTTNGNSDLLTDITADNDIGIWINPVALPIILDSVRAGIEEQVTSEGAVLSNLVFSLIEGAIHISAHADKGNWGSLDFSLNAVPHLIRPGYHEEWDEEYGEHFEINTPPREELWFENTDIKVDINRPWWAYLSDVIGVFVLYGIGTIIVESYVTMIRNNKTSSILNTGGDAKAERVQEFTIAGLMFKLKIETYECHAQGIYIGMTLKPQILSSKVDGPQFIALEEVGKTTIRYNLRLPYNYLPDDPMLRIRWTVVRTDTNIIIKTEDKQAQQNVILDLTDEPALLKAPELHIAVRLYSTLGPVTNDIFNTSIALRITDVLDRTHPFVFWEHEVSTPVIQIEQDGSKTMKGFQIKKRISAIHRTDFPGRCRMVSRYSPKVSRTDNGSDRPHLQYLDQLPFPVNQLSSRRSIVCDYCFFGGPEKKIPLI